MIDGNNYDQNLFVSAAQMSKANNYNEWTFSLFRQYIRGNVLEVGCGVGSFTRRIVEYGAFEHLLSIDISQSAVDYCLTRFAHPNLQLQCIDARDVHGQFDLIVCMNVLEHIEDHEGALRHLFDILSPGGTLFLLVPAHQELFNRFDTEGGHFRRYNKRSIRELLGSVTGSSRYKLEQFYFNSIGALGYWFVYKMLNKVPQNSAKSEIGLFDTLIVPVIRRIEGRFMPFGISVISLITKG